MKNINQQKTEVVVVGSIALDTITTPAAMRRDVLGGSVSFACVAASFFANVGMVGIVGTDFPEKYIRLLRRFGIDLSGLQREQGRTFRWSGVYEQDMDNRRTISTDLNVFAGFSPELPESYREAPFLFLANIAPDLQLKVLSQARSPRFTAADTMDLWIRTARDPLMEVISKVDMLLLNDSEARELSGESHLVKAAARLLEQGPRYVAIKKGQHGCMVLSEGDVFLMPAYPVPEVHDPTGAGDAFAGGMIGFLASSGRLNTAGVRRAMAAGTVAASFAVESFGLEKLARISRADIKQRGSEFMRMIRMPAA